MDFSDIVFIFCVAFLGVLTVKNIVRAVRALVIAKRSVILKVMINWLVIADAALFVACIIFSVKSFSDAAAYRAEAGMYEEILGIGGITGGLDGYQHVSSLFDSRAEIEEAVRDLYYDAELMNTVASYALVIGIFQITLGWSSIVFITEKGMVMGSMQLPEPIIAIYEDGRIGLYVKAQLANGRRITSFKATPKNIAVFGRFIEPTVPEAQTPVPSAPDSNNMLT